MVKPLLSWQVLRFGVVGITMNALLYLSYLALVVLGLPYQVAMTASYIVGVVLGYTLQRRWTFRHRGPSSTSAVRYLVAYVGGYVLNLLGLYLLVEQAKFGPKVAQGAMILVVAVCLYLAQKSWVFRPLQSPAVGDGDGVASRERRLFEIDPR